MIEMFFGEEFQRFSGMVSDMLKILNKKWTVDFFFIKLCRKEFSSI